MCIRDREYGIDILRVQEIRSYEEPTRIANAPPFIKGVVNPVSYTHLRAHETVLDLVCRLLLEKKKHTHTTYTHA